MEMTYIYIQGCFRDGSGDCMRFILCMIFLISFSQALLFFLSPVLSYFTYPFLFLYSRRTRLYLYVICEMGPLVLK